MLHFFLGIVIGSVVGLTGAGGALISIPLFMHFLHLSLKDASVYSLLSVIFASFINFIMQKKEAQIKTSIFLVLFSAVGSYLSSPWKSVLSNFYVSLLIIIISLFALFNVWKKQAFREKQHLTSFYIYWGIVIFSGFILGILTTFTGLGGGVLMVPVMLRFLNFNQQQAVASSLFVITISSAISLIIQVSQGFVFALDVSTLVMFGGMLCSALLIKLLMKHVSTHRLLLIQRIIFSMVVLASWLKLLST